MSLVVASEITDTSLTPYVISLTLSASLSGLLFGYDTGVISGTLVAIRSDLGHALSISEKSAITAATTLGALIGALCAPIADRGRKKALGIANVLFITGALMQAVASTVGLMVAGRVVVGLGVGLASATAPLYIGELAPRALRGRLVTVNVLTCTGGQVVAYGVFTRAARLLTSADNQASERCCRTTRADGDGWSAWAPRLPSCRFCGSDICRKVVSQLFEAVRLADDSAHSASAQRPHPGDLDTAADLPSRYA